MPSFCYASEQKLTPQPDILEMETKVLLKGRHLLQIGDGFDHCTLSDLSQGTEVNLGWYPIRTSLGHLNQFDGQLFSVYIISKSKQAHFLSPPPHKNSENMACSICCNFWNLSIWRKGMQKNQYIMQNQSSVDYFSITVYLLTLTLTCFSEKGGKHSWEVSRNLLHGHRTIVFRRYSRETPDKNRGLFLWPAFLEHTELWLIKGDIRVRPTGCSENWQEIIRNTFVPWVQTRNSHIQGLCNTS